MSPFQFILNHSRATATNVYLLLYPKEKVLAAIANSPERKRRIWELLKNIRRDELLNESRVYGGGLHKLEPKELGRVRAGSIGRQLTEWGFRNVDSQLEFLSPTS